MRWDDLPNSTNIQNTAYGPQLPFPLAPADMGAQAAVARAVAHPSSPFFRQRQPRPMSPPDLTTLTAMGLRPPLSAQQNQWLQQNMPQVPTTQLQDPSFPLDPTIMAQARAAQQRAARAQIDLPTPMQPDSNQLMGTTLNSVPWGQWQ